MVTIRIGLPNPVGEALGSAKVAADGTWQATVVLPGTLPSGQSITAETVQLVAMDENNRAYDSVPVKFTPSGGGSAQPPAQGNGAYPSTPQGVVDAFMKVFVSDPASPDLQQYLSTFRKMSASPVSIAGLMNAGGKIGSYTSDPGRVNDAGDNAAVVVKIVVGGVEQTRVFTLVKEKEAWYVDNIATPSQ
jgi:hypothetical protein